MPTSHFPPAEAKELLKKIKDRRRGMNSGPQSRTQYTPEEYERDVHALLLAMFPFSVLPGLRLFSAARRQFRDHGFELDNLLHLRLGETDHIIIVESKKPRITVGGGQWTVGYSDGPKCAKDQVDNHVRTLWEYLRPIAQGVDLKFVAIVCTLEPSQTVSAAGYRNADLNIVCVDALFDFLAEKFLFKSAEEGFGPEVLRVSQSSFLSMLRLGVYVPSLGHPEASSAVKYVERCRRALDATLFLDFKPKRTRWAINGSAGMGKSVLLAYSAAVLASGREWKGPAGEEFAQPSDLLETIGYSPAEADGPIYVLAMTPKQLEQLQKFYNEFVTRFQAGDYRGQITFRRVEFVVCREAKKMGMWCDQASALLVDEAHDLPAYAAKIISETHNQRGFYLVVAYDRHQKLRLTRSDARILEGVDFKGKQTQLGQVYRNPAPIYMASLALMFRWGAAEGPKVMPDAGDLKSNFAFDVKDLAGGDVEISMKTDAHPANSWSHTVATFPDAETAFRSLESDRMGHEEVLWVRFCEEDKDFDYEALRRFTYHNCRNHDSDLISDKYVKGQEYPIVVIEGFPSFMDRYEDSDDGEADEGKMWKFRREVYLCASRATCFLYIVCKPRQFTKENHRIVSELNYLVESLAVPAEAARGGTRLWSLRIKQPSESRAVAEVDDIIAKQKSPARGAPAAITPEVVGEKPPALEEAVGPKVLPDVSNLERPVTVKSLAKALGVKSYVVTADLMSLRIFAANNQVLNDDQIAAVCRLHDLEYKAPLREVEAGAEIKPKPQKTAIKEVEEAAEPPKAAKASIPSKQQFEHSIEIEGPISAVELAALLGLQKRDVIIEAQRIGIPVTGATRLGLYAIERIAAVFDFGVTTK
jgi:hypothetical protein